MDGYAKGSFAASPFKPSNFVDACKKLENNANVPRSFQILIPRMLPSLYEIRNNRNVGHVGGDVDPNFMDSQAVVSMCSWVVGELIRVVHNSSIDKAQTMVDSICSRKIPLVWSVGDMKRVLKPSTTLKDQILLLVGIDNTKTNVSELLNWIEYKNKTYFLKTLRGLHQSRFIELSTDEKNVEILPPGSMYIEKLVAEIINE